jgi:hypothetical protein
VNHVQIDLAVASTSVRQRFNATFKLLERMYTSRKSGRELAKLYRSVPNHKFEAGPVSFIL